MDENSNMTAERSLEIISQMVEQTRWRIQNEYWRPSLYYGIACVVIAIAVYIIWHLTGYAGANGLWGILGILSLLPPFKFKKHGQTMNPNLLQQNILSVWKCVGIVCGAVGLVCIGMTFFMDAYYHSLLRALLTFELQVLASIIILICGVGTMITGYIARLKVITICGFITGIAGSVLALLIEDEEMMLVLAGSFAVLLVIPALLIKKDVKPCLNR